MCAWSACTGVERGRELVERLVERPLEQVLLARHVVVDRRLGQPELASQVAHARGVVALPVEELDRDAQDRLLVVAGPAPPYGALTWMNVLMTHHARPEDHTVLDLTPRPGDLDPIETAPVEELRALQLERLQWSVRHAYDNVAHYRAAFDEAGVHPDDIRVARRPGEAAVHHQGRRCATTTRSACSRCRARTSYACTPPAGRPASRPSSATPRDDLDMWADVVARSIRAAGGRRGMIAAQRLRLRALHRRPRRARRRRAPRLHGGARLGRHDAAPGAADPRLRARHHHGDAVLHALDPRRARGAGRRPALDVAQGRHLRRRAVDQRHAPRDGAAHRHARGRHLRPVRGDRPRRGERVRRDQGRPARLGGPLLPRGHRPGDRRGAARRRGGRAGLHHAHQAGDAGDPLPHPRPDPAAAGHRAQHAPDGEDHRVAPTT